MDWKNTIKKEQQIDIKDYTELLEKLRQLAQKHNPNAMAHVDKLQEELLHLNTERQYGRLVQKMDSEEYDYYYGDGSKGDIPRNPPKGNERIKVVKEAFREVDDAREILQAASSWSSPETYERIEQKLSELVKEIKALEKEALEYHGKE